MQWYALVSIFSNGTLPILLGICHIFFQFISFITHFI